MTDQVLTELRVFVEANGMASTATLRRWLAMLEQPENDNVRDAREQARRDG